MSLPTTLDVRSETDAREPHDPLQRPTWACALCPPPKRAGAWRPADQSFATCAGCDQGLRDRLADVAQRYLRLDARPGGTGDYGHRGAPGFASRPPCNLHVVSMRDPRSSGDAHVWVGQDGRVHREAERPPLSVHGTLSCVAWQIAEHRGVEGPDDRADVFGLLRFLDRHLVYATRHAELAGELDAAARDLQGQLRPATGDARRRIGLCPAQVASGPDGPADLESPCRCGHLSAQHDNDATGDRRCHGTWCDCRTFIPLRPPIGDPRPGSRDATEPCGAALFAPLHGADAITCPSCGAHWDYSDWMALGDLLLAAELGLASPAA